MYIQINKPHEHALLYVGTRVRTSDIYLFSLKNMNYSH